MSVTDKAALTALGSPGAEAPSAAAGPVSSDSAAGGTSGPAVAVETGPGAGSADSTVGSAAGPAADARASGVGPVWEVLREVRAGLEQLHGLLASGGVPASEILAVTTGLHEVVSVSRAAHSTAVGVAAASGMWAPEGFLSAASWIRASHRLDGGRARTVTRIASWLEQHPHVAEAFTTGAITAEHVSGIVSTVSAKPGREQVFAQFEADLLVVAKNTDPAATMRILRAWADTVDSTMADEDAEAAYDRRGVRLSQVGDGWDVKGWLPAALGAELAGILNEVMDAAWRDNRHSKDECASVRRADALLDIARKAATSGFSAGVKDRAKVSILIPIHRLHTCHSGDNHNDPHKAGAGHGAGDCDHRACGHKAGAGHGAGGQAGAGRGLCLGDATPDSPGVPVDPDRPGYTYAASWRTGNGIGDGILAMNEAEWLSCDADITRILLDGRSQPLDIGRSTRVIPTGIRKAVELRDGGCVAPGCERPPAYCEAHHIRHWAQGGSTDLSNLVSLCTAHHHQLHLGKWIATTGENGTPAIRKPHPGEKPPKHRPD